MLRILCVVQLGCSAGGVETEARWWTRPTATSHAAVALYFVTPRPRAVTPGELRLLIGWCVPAHGKTVEHRELVSCRSATRAPAYPCGCSLSSCILQPSSQPQGILYAVGLQARRSNHPCQFPATAPSSRLRTALPVKYCTCLDSLSSPSSGG